LTYVLMIDEQHYRLREAVVAYHETKEPFYLPCSLPEGEDVFLATSEGIVAYAEVLFQERTKRPDDPFWVIEADETEGDYVCLDLIGVDVLHPLLKKELFSFEEGKVTGEQRFLLLQAWREGYGQNHVPTVAHAKKRRRENFLERNHFRPLDENCSKCGLPDHTILEWHLNGEVFETVCPNCHAKFHREEVSYADEHAT